MDPHICRGFVAKTMEIDGVVRRYVVYVPQDYTHSEQWPLVLALHGSGERGDDGLRHTEHGISSAIRQWPDRFPCIVVLPQCWRSSYWTEIVPHIDTALALTLDEYNTDPSRHYITGLSMGGYATWAYAAAHPETFAAMVPICGGGDPGTADRLSGTPIWAFHGAEDMKVLPQESRVMVEAVRRAGGKVSYTEYPGIGHFSWERTYNNPKVIRWLLRQRRR